MILFISGADPWFITQCNIVRPEIIIFDGTNQRLLITNFGNAVDLDPPRLGLDNDSIELNVPGSITNTPAADVFSAAVILCQLLFGISSMQLMQQQLKSVNYDLDLWLQKAKETESFPSDALGYLYPFFSKAIWTSEARTRSCVRKVIKRGERFKFFRWELWSIIGADFDRQTVSRKSGTQLFNAYSRCSIFQWFNV